MLSFDLRQILPPKCHFSFAKKCKFRQKIWSQIPNFANFANFVKFRQKSIFSSRRPFFVISSVFRQKRNPLEPTRNDTDTGAIVRCGCGVYVGMWYDILNFINIVGVVTNACLIAFTSSWGNSRSLTDQLIIVLVFEVIAWISSLTEPHSHLLSYSFTRHSCVS